ncbi:MAG TPA: 2-oxoglutarate dehydrogenase E1 component [Polyangiaceae bacterium]|nr:2-oxoglutarate dehydrogenase E1 component [Polyangiaceae bacterium]
MDEFGINSGYVAEQLDRYLNNPESVDESWRRYFQGRLGHKPAPYTNGNGNGNGTTNGRTTAALAAPTPERPAPTAMSMAEVQGRVSQLINAYRVRGHLFARVDPLRLEPAATPQLELGNFDLVESDLDRSFSTIDMPGPKTALLRDIITRLESTYCRSIGVEFTHVEEPEERFWLQERMESSQNRLKLGREEQIRILTKLTDAEIFEQFIHKNYVGAKRFSLEGAESMIPLLDLLVETAGGQGVEEIVLAMAHRGRLNVLANIMNKNIREIFAAFEDGDPEKYLGSGDVKYHLGYSTDHRTAQGHKVHLTLAFNPSHLEWVNPVVEGRVRAKQDRRGDRDRRRVMPLIVHGDAAFMGQGVVAETLNLAGLAGYSTGGTIHVVVNNQIGFTTVPGDARSTRYATDITRMLKVPVFHVNGEDPEAVGQVAKLAIEFRQRFGKDVVVDMYCYRRYGHNEADEPRFTQPLMYSIIDKKPSVREVYVRRLLEMGQITTTQAEEIVVRRRAVLDAALEEARKGDFSWVPTAMGGLWSHFAGGADALVPEVPTAVPKDELLDLCRRAVTLPADFHANPKIARLFEQRLDKVEKGQPLDWAVGEMLAYASLVSSGVPVRLTGQDARRGTFSHRHATIVDVKSGSPYVPLAAMGTGNGRFEVWDSPLSEAGCLGFEYGYSLDYPDGLTIWEAQFGDFVNSAQVIIDQFVISGEDKWHRLSSLVLFLPHAYEGQGPEHSSARLERFMQQAAEDNIQVCNLTTSAQIFHVLRRQVLRPWRKPLIIMTPKGLLRLPTSTIEEFTHGSFQRVIGDASGVEPADVRRILLCSGKVYYDLDKKRKELGATDVAIIRLEQLYPLSDAIAKALAPYRDGTPLTWVQDEPWNMGAWYSLNARLPGLLDRRFPLNCVARAESASPATGSHASHDLEQSMLLEAAFKR